nr:hypothetical protein GCM10017745_63520 [Saccharothrix mutabilis subsp. capreolus]
MRASGSAGSVRGGGAGAGGSRAGAGGSRAGAEAAGGETNPRPRDPLALLRDPGAPRGQTLRPQSPRNRPAPASSAPDRPGSRQAQKPKRRRPDSRTSTSFSPAGNESGVERAVMKG